MKKHRNLEEEFQQISPPGYRGIPVAQPIAGGYVSGGASADSGGSLSSAFSAIAEGMANQTAQNAVVQKQQASAASGGSGGGVVAELESLFGGGSSSSGFLSGLLDVFSPLASLVKGIASLFGGSGAKANTDSPYFAPPSVQLSDTLRAATPTVSASASAVPAAAPAAASSASSQPITVQVSTMDSQSFQDNASKIADAVRTAMLNGHPINDVIANT